MRSDYKFIKKYPPHDTSQWVKIRIKLRNNETREIREYDDCGIFNEDSQSVSTFIYEEGNFSCDCNRQLFWWRAKNEKQGKLTCSDGRFSLNIYATNGKEIYKEF